MLTDMGMTCADVTAPVLTCPNHTLTTDAGVATHELDFSSNVSALDNVDGATTVVCDKDFVTNFSVGTTTVTCNSSDAESNVGVCSFEVTVNGT